jgi:hypothetical protein
MRSVARKSTSLRKMTRRPRSIKRPQLNVAGAAHRSVIGFISFSDYFGIPRRKLNRCGVFDLILNRDSPLSIDPRLLNTSSEPEFDDAYDDILRRFRRVFKLLRKSSIQNDRFWRAAEKFLDFHELKGVSLGYSDQSNRGKGWDTVIRTQVLHSAKAVLDAGLDDPEFFELLALFEKRLGADRISDMVGTIIRPRLFIYTRRICKELGVKTKEFVVGTSTEKLPWYVDDHKAEHYVTLVPKDILSALPIQLNRENIAEAADNNEALRDTLNRDIGADWRRAIVQTSAKEATRAAFFSNIDAFRKFIEEYRHRQAFPYDFIGDPKAVKLWYDLVRSSEGKQLALSLPNKPTKSEVFAVVQKIVIHFKRLVEHNRLRNAFFIGDRVRHEGIVQVVFQGIAEAHCEYNDLDLSPETDAGHGRVDFKFSSGKRAKVIVEIKLSNSSKLISGFETQVAAYKTAENTDQSLYLVIDVGKSGAAIGKLRNVAVIAAKDGEQAPQLVIADATKKPSASKRGRRREAT